MTCLLIEAESFTDLGGWVVDQQAMDAMGSPFLLAHGLGEPVAPARTTIAVPAAGAWRLWVRTRDWAPPHGPGAFRVHLDGRALPVVFGTGGDGRWAWHDGGTVVLAGASAVLELEDLTGFDGRCDALLLCDDGSVPPDDGAELAAFRRRCLGLPARAPTRGRYDLVVAGGGYAGICAAITAARHGLRVALVQDRPVLGGNASAEVRVGPIGGTDLPPFPRNGEVVRQLGAGAAASGGVRHGSNDAQVLALVRAEPGIDLLLEHRLVAVEHDGARITAVVAASTRGGVECRLEAPLFADCTGDASLGVLAGAAWMSGREGRDQTGESLAPDQADGLRLGNTLFWHALPTGAPSGFPACPWALPIASDDHWQVSPPKWPAKLAGKAFVGGWNWETGFHQDAANEAEAIRDHALRAIYGTWDWLKNRSPERARYADARLGWVGWVLGKRETRRLVGDVVLCQQDLEEQRPHPDACVTATWYFDLHFPHPDNGRHFPGGEFRSLAYDDPAFERLRGAIPGHYTGIRPYALPYRCLYARDVPNLFMAGRNISCTHVGLAPVRTMMTTGMMGTVVGRAALVCQRHRCDPRAVYTDHLAELLGLLADPGQG